MKAKLALQDLKVESFITALPNERLAAVRGGDAYTHTCNAQSVQNPQQCNYTGTHQTLCNQSAQCASTVCPDPSGHVSCNGANCVAISVLGLAYTCIVYTIALDIDPNTDTITK